MLVTPSSVSLPPFLPLPSPPTSDCQPQGSPSSASEAQGPGPQTLWWHVGFCLPHTRPPFENPSRGTVLLLLLDFSGFLSQHLTLLATG